MGIDSANIQKLEALLEPHRQEMDVLAEALKEVTKEEGEKKKLKAKELIVQALELQAKMSAAESRFNSEKNEFEKKLGKLIKQIQNMANNRPIDEGVQNNEGDESA